MPSGTARPFLLALLLCACASDKGDSGNASGTPTATAVAGGTPSATGQTTPLTFTADVHPLLFADCESCHASGAGGYIASADLDESFDSAITVVDTGSPASSALLTKPALDGATHAGGAISGYGVGEANYAIILQWITDGAVK